MSWCLPLERAAPRPLPVQHTVQIGASPVGTAIMVHAVTCLAGCQQILVARE